VEVQLLRRVLVGVFVLCLAVALTWSFAAKAGQPVSKSKPEFKKTDKPAQTPGKMMDLAVGDTIPDHRLADLRGNVVKLSSLLHKRTIISFFLPGCDVCEQEISDLVSVVRDSADYHYFIFMSSSSANQIAKSVPSNRQLLVLRDSGSVYGKLLGIQTVPLNMIVDRSGRIEKITEDAMTLEDYKKIIEFNRVAESKAKSSNSGSK
jgi:peroxiredoxin